MEANDINDIIIRYLDDSADLEEKALLLWWLKQSDKNRSDFSITRDLWLSCNVATENELEVDIALSKLKKRIFQEQERISIHPHLEKKSNSRFLRWTQIAAVSLILIGAGFGLGIWKKQTMLPEIITLNQIITAKGSKGQTTLPDGSIVWLNSESKLTYPKLFAGNKRLVTLEGGAYFEVAKETERPFIVQTEGINIEVLGTCFNIDSYLHSESIKTALLSGSIKISGKEMEDPIYLKPNELFKYKKEDHRVSVEKANVSLYTDWIKDRMTFDNSYLSDILISMEGRYNMDILCSDPELASVRLSLTIRQENLEEVLKALTVIIPIQYEISGRKVIIKPKK
ncbi:FecR domain-containing protein [Massilibacteroides sp.]|uniref:FecR family protein n=1 Tax=Massilibacteroides sp. TaxID=2034766 RepID=UPI0026097087|nr:FecR domain-containing protein [Massilibacteroides sp.]MDD4514095.1 FecR domain-containing protein [Massilibacteroides sp.]